jgi:hypothetical protein
MPILLSPAVGLGNVCSRSVIQFETITCPYCWEPIEIALDLSVDEQQQVEDCSVCCRPIVIRYSAAEGELLGLDVAAENRE